VEPKQWHQSLFIFWEGMKVQITEFHTQNLLLYFMFRVLNSINAEQEVLAEGHDDTLLSPLLLKVW
jgi:hypothetical protein